jgi:hypothetical protein
MEDGIKKYSQLEQLDLLLSFLVNSPFAIPDLTLSEIQIRLDKNKEIFGNCHSILIHLEKFKGLGLIAERLRNIDSREISHFYATTDGKILIETYGSYSKSLENKKMISQKENELWFKILKFLSKLDSTKSHLVNEILEQESPNEDILVIKRAFDRLVNEGYIFRHASFSVINRTNVLSNTRIYAQITSKGVGFIDESLKMFKVNSPTFIVHGNMAIGDNIKQSQTTIEKTIENETFFSKKNIMNAMWTILGALLVAFFVFKMGWN